MADALSIALECTCRVSWESKEDRDAALAMAYREFFRWAGGKQTNRKGVEPEDIAKHVGDLEQVYGVLSRAVGIQVKRPTAAVALIHELQLGDDFARRFSRLTSRRRAVCHTDASFMADLTCAIGKLDGAQLSVAAGRFRSGAMPSQKGRPIRQASDTDSARNSNTVSASTRAEGTTDDDGPEFSFEALGYFEVDPKLPADTIDSTAYTLHECGQNAVCRNGSDNNVVADYTVDDDLIMRSLSCGCYPPREDASCGSNSSVREHWSCTELAVETGLLADTEGNAIVAQEARVDESATRDEKDLCFIGAAVRVARDASPGFPGIGFVVSEPREDEQHGPVVEVFFWGNKKSKKQWNRETATRSIPLHLLDFGPDATMPTEVLDYVSRRFVATGGEIRLRGE